MKTIVFTFIITAFTTQVQGEDVADLLKILETSMNKVNAYGNEFVGPLKKRLDSEYSITKESLDMVVNQSYNNSLRSVKSAAEKHGVDASDCVKDLKQELEGIVKDKLPGFDYCIKHTMDFAMEFAPFIQNQGNTGYVMIEGLEIVTKSYAKLPVSQAEKCYEGLNFYVSAVSYNYRGTSDRYLSTGKSLHTYAIQNVLNCFQRPIELIRAKIEEVEGRVNKCITNKINNKP